MKLRDRVILLYSWLTDNIVIVLAAISVLAACFFNQPDRLDTFIRMNIFIPVILFLFMGMAAFKVHKDVSELGKNKYKRELINKENIIYFVILAGFFLRLIYVLFTSVVERQNDAGIFEANEGGHIGYIYYVFTNMTLPDFDPRLLWQYYHPPLHYVLEALWLKVNVLLGFSTDKMVENIQILPLFYSGCILVVVNRIMKKVNISALVRLIIIAILSIYPYFIMMAGAVNNDALVTLLMLLCINGMIEWYKKPTLYNILVPAVCIGFGMMTKLSAVLLAPAMAMLFVWKLVVEIKKNKKSINEYIKQYSIFAIISIPAGIWYPIRNLIRFDVPITYVPSVGENSYQSLNMISVYDRVFSITKGQLKNYFMTWDSAADDCTYNIFLSLLKYGAFNEQSSNMDYYPAGRWVGYSLLLVILLLTVFILALAIRWFIRIKEESLLSKDDIQHKPEIKLYMIITAVTIFASYFKFCFEYNQICTMNIRYVLIPIIICMVASAHEMDICRQYVGKKAFIKTTVFTCVSLILILFFIFSIISYRCMLGI